MASDFFKPTHFQWYCMIHVCMYKKKNKKKKENALIAKRLFPSKLCNSFLKVSAAHSFPFSSLEECIFYKTKRNCSHYNFNCKWFVMVIKLLILMLQNEKVIFPKLILKARITFCLQQMLHKSHTRTSSHMHWKLPTTIENALFY